ncbi:MAG TPA: hypothetical protein PK673_07600, partial [Paludibacteraceae bacterium]|nr:hypothetical protein [Paludibacteraceae bacterium]
MDWHKEAVRLSLEENKNAREIYDILKNIDPELKTLGDTHGYQRVRQYIKKYRRKHNLRRDCAGNDLTPKAVAQKSSYSFQNGNHIYEDIIEIIDGRPITPQVIMEAHKLATNEWDVIAFTSNCWQQQTDGGGKIDLCQSKLTVKPKKQPEISLADVDAYFDEKRFKPIVPLTDYKYIDDGEVLEVTYVDPHNGLLTWQAETGENYDLKIAQERFLKCAWDIVSRCKHKKIKRIILCMLGDVLHTANDNQTTEKGTFQSVDGRYVKITDTTEATIVNVIAILKSIAPVEVVWVSGNHSRISEYLVMRSVEKSFSDVKFDIAPNPIKSIKIGNALIGLAHGDMPKKNITNNVDREARMIGG